jgi:D-alanyl-D-alanine carboxypeptidase
MSFLKSIILFLLFLVLPQANGLTPRYSAIVIDAHSGRVLQQEEADKICHPASLTKMMTLYIIFENLKSGKLRMGTQVYVSSHAARQIPSKLGLRPGEYVSIETIIKGLVTKSANDASAAIAEHLGGSEVNFASIMTRKARTLGMRNTTFKNASGVPNSQQVTTARDMAILSRSLFLHFPKEYRYFRMKSFQHKGRVHRNHNHLLGNRRGLDIDGIKTGYVAASGFNLAASAVGVGSDNKPRRLIAVVLGGPNRHWRDRRVADLLENNFEKVGLTNVATTKNYNDSDYDDSQDDEDEDAAVNAILKEESKPAAVSKYDHSSVRPISLSWPSKSTNSDDEENDHQSSSENSWGVQLGTFKSVGEAKVKAKQLLSKIHSGEISTPKVTKGKKSFYGARLIGITKAEAQRACKKYARNYSDCRILATD